MAAHRKLTFDQIEDAKAAYHAGGHMAELAIALGVSSTVLWRRLREAGYTPRKSGKTLSPAERAQRAEARREQANVAKAAKQRAAAAELEAARPLLLTDARRGMTISQLATRWPKLSTGVIRAWLLEAGITPPVVHLEPIFRRQALPLPAPLTIPTRTDQERRRRAWSKLEQAAIAVEIAAGRVSDVRRGYSSLQLRRHHAAVEQATEQATRSAQSRWAHPKSAAKAA